MQSDGVACWGGRATRGADCPSGCQGSPGIELCTCVNSVCVHVCVVCVCVCAHGCGVCVCVCVCRCVLVS